VSTSLGVFVAARHARWFAAHLGEAGGIEFLATLAAAKAGAVPVLLVE